MISKEEVERAVRDKLAEGNAKFKANATVDTILYVPRLSYDGSATLGSAGYDTNDDGTREFYLKFSMELFQFDPQFLISEVVPHEVAHLITMWLYLNKIRSKYAEMGHGKAWEHVAKVLGSSGKEKVDYRYKLDSGDEISLSLNQHYDVSRRGHKLRTKHGERITADMYQGPNI